MSTTTATGLMSSCEKEAVVQDLAGILKGIKPENIPAIFDFLSSVKLIPVTQLWGEIDALNKKVAGSDRQEIISKTIARVADSRA